MRFGDFAEVGETLQQAQGLWVYDVGHDELAPCADGSHTVEVLHEVIDLGGGEKGELLQLLTGGGIEVDGRGGQFVVEIFQRGGFHLLRQRVLLDIAFPRGVLLGMCRDA